MKGIYYYIDSKDDSIAYIGRDSYIDTDKRKKEHLHPSRYNEQPFNRILQNNPDRYVYNVWYKTDDLANEELNFIEESLIEHYDPKFNFTDGGGGILGYKHTDKTKAKLSELGSQRVGEKNGFYGKKHTEETKQKNREAHQKKDVFLINRSGFNSAGYQNYGLKYNGKIINRGIWY